MSAVTKTKITEAEYLAKDEANGFRSEFYKGEMFAMAGGSASHNRIIENLSIRVGGKLWGSECQTLSSDQRVKVVATGLNTFPDFLIVCGKPEYTAAGKHTLTNPKILVEVLSPSNELYDRSTKFEHFKKIPTLSEYILVAQDRPFIESFVRQPDQTWLYRAFEGLDQEFQLASIGISLPMSEIFARVEFETSNDMLRVSYPDVDS